MPWVIQDIFIGCLATEFGSKGPTILKILPDSVLRYWERKKLEYFLKRLLSSTKDLHGHWFFLLELSLILKEFTDLEIQTLVVIGSML